jgi:cell division septation protein DedD
VNTNASTDAGPAPYEVPTLSPFSGSAMPDSTAPSTTAPATTTTTTSTDTTTTADAGSAATTGTVADNYRIQLAAVKSQADADKAWKRILAKHTDVLGSLTVHIVRADLGTQGIYYRVQAGPFADKASAQSVCEQLKSSGQQCLVKP